MAIRPLIAANQRAAAAIKRRLPHARVSPFDIYDAAVRRRVAALSGGLVVDVGGGRRCDFADAVDRATTRIAAVDVSAEELSHNHDVDERHVADAGERLPFADASADLVVSRTVLEHVADVGRFVAESARVLRPGGYAVHLVPCRYAPFALLSRAIPLPLARRLLFALRPQAMGVAGFPTYYDSCFDGRLRALHEDAGFSSYRSVVTYYQSDYYDAFLPAYLASVAYELGVRALRLRNLGAYVVIVARR